MEKNLENNLFKFNSMGKIECNKLINVECCNDKVIITNNNNITKGLRFYESVNDFAISEIIDKLVVEARQISLFKNGEFSRAINLDDLETLKLDAVENTEDNSTEITCIYTYTQEAIDRAEQEETNAEQATEMEVSITEIMPNYMEHLNNFLNLQILEYNRLLLSMLIPNLKVNGLLDSITIVSPGEYPVQEDIDMKEE